MFSLLRLKWKAAQMIKTLHKYNDNNKFIFPLRLNLHLRCAPVCTLVFCRIMCHILLTYFINSRILHLFALYTTKL